MPKKQPQQTYWGYTKMKDLSVSINNTGTAFNMHNIPGLVFYADPGSQISANGSSTGKRFNDNILLNQNVPVITSNTELLLNNDFSDGYNYWTVTGNWRVINSIININNSALDSIISQSILLETGKLYKISIAINVLTTGKLKVNFNGSEIAILNSTGKYHFYYHSTSSGASGFSLEAIEATTVLSGLSVREVVNADYAILQNGMESNTLQSHNGLYFNGIDSKIDFGNRFNPGTKDILTGIWIKPNHQLLLPNTLHIITKSTPYQFFFVSIEGNPSFYLSSGEQRYQKTIVNICDNEWHFVVLVHRHSGETYMVVDNEIESQHSSNVLNELENTASFSLGGSNAGNYLNGELGMFFYAEYDVTEPTTPQMPTDVTKIINLIYENCVFNYT